ncbi:hypothetical protein GGR56DRAFT_621183 [Xylariaceae sp. FL0804]|nr:hypothetical protein GGR56DRAFT_621183 [Xylariaceae sp. FL0804]
MLALLVIGLAVGLGVGLGTGKDSSSSTTPAATTTPSSPSPSSPSTPSSSSSSPSSPSSSPTPAPACPGANATTYTTSSGSGGAAASFRILCDVDYNSGGGSVDLAHVVTDTATACLAACAADSSCAGAGWGDYQGQEICWMKRSLAAPQGADNWYFGVKQ